MPDRILLVSPASPFNPQSGAQQRTRLLLDALRMLGEVDVLLIEPTAGSSRLEPPSTGIIAHGFWRQHPFGIRKFSPDYALNLALKNAGIDLSRYRLIVGRYLNPIAKLIIPPGVRSVVDLDDWGYRYESSLLLSAQVKSRYAAWLSKRQLIRFDRYFFISRRDQERHEKLKSVLLPNIPFKPPAQPFQQVNTSTLLFVGSLWYAPNRQGIDRFLANCWPSIKAAEPEARLLLAGAASQALRSAWERHLDVFAPGYVDDLDEVYRSAAFTIAPIYSGGGTNIKILESLAYGRACVTTSYGACAFRDDLAQACLGVVSDDVSFSELCIAWLRDMEQRRIQAENSRNLLEKCYSQTLFNKRVRQLALSDA